MTNNGKVQTNNEGINILVETTNSNNRHIWHLNKNVKGVKKLTDQEILDIWNTSKKDELALAKDWIKKQKGYATSNCVDLTLKIDYDSIVKYKLC